jgi:hypothetical protein
MNEADLDLALRSRLTRLAERVPVDTHARTEPGPVTRLVRPRVIARPVARGSLIPVAAAVIAVASVGLIIRWQQSTVGSSEAAVSATSESGPYRLTITSVHGRYRAGDPISISATLEYTGPDPSIIVPHDSEGPVQFGLVEPVGEIGLGPASRLVCGHTTMDRGTPISIPFRKSGGAPNPSDRAAISSFFADPALHLPPGTWHVFADADLNIAACGGTGPDYPLRATIQIEVGRPDESAPSDVPSPLASQAPIPVDTLAPGEVALPTHAPASVCPLAATSGRLTGSADDPWLVWLVYPSGTRVNVLWSPGFRVRFDHGLELLDRYDRVIAGDGDLVTLGGAGQPGPSGEPNIWTECGSGDVIKDTSGRPLSITFSFDVENESRLGVVVSVVSDDAALLPGFAPGQRGTISIPMLNLQNGIGVEIQDGKCRLLAQGNYPTPKPFTLVIEDGPTPGTIRLTTRSDVSTSPIPLPSNSLEGCGG